jgi:SAM-dependent methyltransferase
MKTQDWYSEWFNTPYYHILYKERNDKDAELFMKNMTSFLNLPKSAHILDLPCGKGRHSIFLNSLGYEVTGGDLAKNSIDSAKKFETDTLKFIVQDMRCPFDNNYDAIFNLFTSFGYFEEDKEDLLILENFKQGLKKGGYFVFDFLNAEKVKLNLVPEETKTVDHITFHIQREIKDGFILKYISFFADGKNHSYKEQVKYLAIDKMKNYFQKARLDITKVFGDYHLNPYESESSDRLIIVAR